MMLQAVKRRLADRYGVRCNWGRSSRPKKDIQIAANIACNIKVFTAFESYRIP